MPDSGDIVGRFALGDVLGRGGMAVVFSAVELGALKRKVACKVLLPHLGAEANFREMFMSEAQLLSQLSHPHIPTLYDAGEDDGVPYMAMELLEGFTLEPLMQASAPPPMQAALAILQQLAEALAATHAARGSDGRPLGIVHRDVSPQNVHVGMGGMVKLLDFGIAASNDRHRYTRTGELRGKLQYLAPEQITRSHEVSSKSDVWAWGVVARELLTGTSLFRDDSEAGTLWNVTAQTVLPMAEAAPGIPGGLGRIIDLCLNRDPDARPTARELARSVAELMQPEAKEQVQAWTQAHALSLAVDANKPVRQAAPAKLSAAQTADSAGPAPSNKVPDSTAIVERAHPPPHLKGLRRGATMAGVSLGALALAGSMWAWPRVNSQNTTKLATGKSAGAATAVQNDPPVTARPYLLSAALPTTPVFVLGTATYEPSAAVPKRTSHKRAVTHAADRAALQRENRVASPPQVRSTLRVNSANMQQGKSGVNALLANPYSR